MDSSSLWCTAYIGSNIRLLMLFLWEFGPEGADLVAIGEGLEFGLWMELLRKVLVLPVWRYFPAINSVMGIFVRKALKVINCNRYFTEILIESLGNISLMKRYFGSQRTYSKERHVEFRHRVSSYKVK